MDEGCHSCTLSLQILHDLADLCSIQPASCVLVAMFTAVSVWEGYLTEDNAAIKVTIDWYLPQVESILCLLCGQEWLHGIHSYIIIL